MIHKEPGPTQERTDRTLYVVFHGEIVLLDDKVSDYIVVAAPRIRSHVYQAGPWLGEQKIDPSSALVLRGVRKGGKSIFEDPDRMLLIDHAPGSSDANWHFLLILPRPDNILPGLVLNLRAGTLQTVGPAGVVLVPSPGKDYPSGVDVHPIFQYTVPPGSEPAIYAATGPENEPLFKAGVGQPDYLSLHISAEEDRKAKDQDTAARHAQEAFSAVKAFLGIEATFVPEGQGTARSPILIPGLDPAEYTMPLATRTDFLRQIGEQQRLGESPDLARFFRKQWTLAGAYIPTPELTEWFPEGTCGSTGARLAEAGTTLEVLRRMGTYIGPDDPLAGS